MTDLVHERCVACRRDSIPVTEAEIAELGAQISGWTIVEHDGIAQLERSFRFSDFVQAQAFTNKLGALAEEEGHHPTIVTEDGKVAVRWWTFALGSLHRNDFIMAAKTDRLAASRGLREIMSQLKRSGRLAGWSGWHTCQQRQPVADTWGLSRSVALLQRLCFLAIRDYANCFVVTQ